MSTAVFGAPEFKASNGLVVKPAANGGVEVGQPGYRDYTPPAATFALEEFFQAKRDEELGRWRWPENPEYVVYAPVGYSQIVRVLDERSAILEVIHRERLEGRGSLMAQAARAYFEAHSERKPWQSAEPREVWVIRTANVANEVAVHVTPEREFQFNDGTRVALDYAAIEEARCIWPVDEMAPAELHAASSQAGLASIRGGL